MAAGLAAVVAAGASLVRLRAREVLCSDAIAAEFHRQGLRDPRPDELERRPVTRVGGWHKFDRWIQTWGGGWRVPVYLLWILALVLFGVADLAVFLLTL